MRATDSLRPPARRGCRPLLGPGTLEPREDTVWSQAQGPGTERMGSCDEGWETPGPVRHWRGLTCATHMRGTRCHGNDVISVHRCLIQIWSCWRGQPSQRVVAEQSWQGTALLSCRHSLTHQLHLLLWQSPVPDLHNMGPGAGAKAAGPWKAAATLPC